jgi:ribosomal protein S18 acetylase RimI-like enzyme
VRAIRPARSDDLAALDRVWREAAGLPRGPDGSVLPLHRYLVEQQHCMLAERDGQVIGFAATVDHGGTTLLSDAFVTEPGRGVGRALLDALYAERPSARRYTAASADPRAIPLYRAFAMEPAATIHYLEGEAATLAPRPAPAARPVAIDDDLVTAMNGWFGRDRAADIQHWRSLGAVAYVVGDPAVGGGLVIADTWWDPEDPEAPATRLGPLAVAEAEADAAADVTIAIVTAALARPDRRPILRLLLAETHPATGPLLAAGFAIVDTDTHLASDPQLVDVTRQFGAADLW